MHHFRNISVTAIAFKSTFFNGRTISKPPDCFTVRKMYFCHYLTPPITKHICCPTGINTKLGISNLVHRSLACVLFRFRT